MRTFVRAVMALLLAVGSTSIGGTARAEGSRCPVNGVSVPAGGDIQAFLTAGLPGDAFCLEAGTYLPSDTLRPRSGQAIYGIAGATVIDGRGLVNALFDGCTLPSVIGSCAQSDPSGVGLFDLTIRRAKVYDVRTGSGWLLDDVTAIDSAQYGIVMRGTGTVVQHSVLQNNGKFGITASYTIGGLLQNSVVAFNNSPANSPGYSGATHFMNSLDLQVLDNQVHDNYGRGIWFDIDSKGALVQGNTVVGQINYPYPNTTYAVGDGIRIEISCNVTVRGNTVTANQGPQIAIDGSDDSLVSGNTVVAPPGQPGIRVAPQEQRTTQPPSKNCDGTLRTATRNTVVSNVITQQGNLPASDYSGILQKGTTGSTTGSTFDGDTYYVKSCSTHLWRWWTGSSAVKVGFTTLQSAYGQELNGRCLIL